MSFVGTRPEVTKYVKKYTKEMRATLLLANDKYYFAELTFTPSGGMMPFNPDKYDLEWGNMLDISDLIRGGYKVIFIIVSCEISPQLMVA